MKKLILLFSLILTSLVSFSQVNSVPVCHVSGDPNLITSIQSLNALIDCQLAYDTLNHRLYQFNNTNTAGNKWILNPDVFSNSIVSTYVQLNPQNNLNGNTESDIQLSNFIFNDIGASLGTNELKLPEGTYNLTLKINTQSNNARTNLRLFLYVDGNQYEFMNGHGYIRAASGHNESSIIFPSSIKSNNSFVIKFTSIRISAGGVVTSDDQSKLIITKIQ